MSGTQIQVPDAPGSFRQGEQYAIQKAEQERRKPILAQLDALKIRQSEQTIQSGKQRMTLQDLAISEKERNRDASDMQDFGRGAAWAMNQPNPEAAWDQVITQYEREGKPVGPLKGRYDLMSMVRDLNNPDYPKQQAIQQNLMSVIQTLPEGRRTQAMALGQAAPQALYKAVGEGMFAGDTSGQLAQLTQGLSEKNKESVTATYAVDPDEAVKLRSRLALQRDKPKQQEKITEGKQKAAGFANRMVNAERILDELEGQTPTAMERFATEKLGTNWFATVAGQKYWSASKDWTRSKLRYESGAAIGEQEAEDEARLYFPIPGDSKEVIIQKKQLREVATQNMIDAGGAAYKGKTPEGIKKSNLPSGTIDNGNGTFTLPDGQVVRRKR